MFKKIIDENGDVAIDLIAVTLFIIIICKIFFEEDIRFVIESWSNSIC